MNLPNQLSLQSFCLNRLTPINLQSFLHLPLLLDGKLIEIFTGGADIAFGHLLDIRDDAAFVFEDHFALV